MTYSRHMGIGSVLLIIVGILLSAGPNAAMAKVIYVTPAGNDAGDGLSWATAKKTVSAGLSTAQSGDEIWVTAGTYTPTSGTDRTIALQLKSGVGLYGGFAGTETLRTQRDSNVNITTLSGDLSGNDGSNFSNNAENSYHVVTGSGTDASAVLDGFAIVGGNANGSTAATQKGGGLYLSGGQATVTHCTFRQNYAVSGGGLALDAASTLTNCRFVGNAATNGGAVYANGSTATPSFVSCLFHGNTASSYGGAIISLTSANTKITNCTLYANTASTAGGGVCTTYPRWTDGIVTTVNSIFWANRDASGYTQAAQITAATPSVKYCCVQGWTGSFGGTGNMGTDPLFVDADGADDIAGTPDDDLHLTSGSPCKDVGDNSSVLGSEDLDGMPRNQPPDGTVDIGVDEYDVPTVATPVFSPDGGEYEIEQQVTITCATQDAVIHYTINGADPTEEDAIIASGGAVTISITTPTTLKAKAFKPGLAASAIKTAMYSMSTVATPAFSPDGGTYFSDPSVTITCSTPSAIIHYTTNGNDPTENDPVVASGNTVSISIVTTTTLKARAFRANWYSSSIKTATYTKAPTVAAPVFSPNGGKYTSNPLVTITCPTTSAVIHYTTNGADPTESDPVITSGGTVTINVVAPTVLKAKAFRSGWIPSNVTQAVYRNYACICVSPAGNDTNDGLRWTSAKKTVTAGLATTVSGDQVWVAAGTYVENITLKAGVALYGGFAGNESMLEQRNWATNVTILDGNQAGSVVTSPYTASNTARVDGFTIRNGTSSGIYCSSSSPTITNNTITKNSGNSGGGINCSGASPTIANNTVVGNNALNGGGIYCGSYSSPTIINNTIIHNAAYYDGGGIYCAYSLTIANTIIAYNSSGICRSGNSPTLNANCVYGNTNYNYSGITDPTGTNGNISADPKLAGSAYGNVHIQPDSPCVGAGNNSRVSGNTDVDGQLRIQPGGGVVDIGADESDGTAWRQGPPVIIHVASNGSDNNDGSSWTLAKLTVQAGIDAATAFGGDVWVKAGVYSEHITIPPYVHMYGGFAGVETEQSQRNWNVNASILDGQSSGSVITFQSGYRISTLDGFTIRNGRGTRSGSYNYGGGIYCNSYSSPTIMNNKLLNNSASYGGGICCYNYSSPLLANNSFNANSAAGGGAIYCYYSSPAILNSVITGNTATDGGGIQCVYSSSLIVNNTFTGNVSSTGGGIYCSSSTPTIVNNIVAFNSTGIYKSSSTGTPTLRNNDFYGNAVYNYSGLSAGTGDMTQDPMLVAVAYGKVHIQQDSPCIDAGDDTVIRADWLDLDGQTRIQGTRVDIGADEYDGTPPETFIPNVVRVCPTGNDSNDGSSWAQAKQTVQAGIDMASTLGGEVWVAMGTYNERISLKPYAYLYGGFQGKEESLSQRNWIVNITILDGGAGGSVVSTSRCGYLASTLDGFTIRNGTGTVSGNDSYGGGISCSGSPSSTTIANNTITGNSATKGGGIYCYNSSQTITNNIISGNTASLGGGIYCSDASSRITRSTFMGNSATSGGGIYCNNGTVIVTNSIITGNTATASGGGIVCGSASVTITNNTIAGNSAVNGGGISCSSSLSTIANNIVAFNASGLFLTSGTDAPACHNNNVYGNTNYNYSGLSAGSGDISVDPLLVAAGYGQIHLTPESPCIDVGDDTAVQTNWLDIDGQSRIQGTHVDIGADEYDGTPSTIFTPSVIRVCSTGNDNNDGSSWELAKRTVQAGIVAASVCGGDVWVAAGIYNERINLKPYVYLYGGFSTTETTRIQRNWATNKTILDGNANGSVVSVLNSGHFVCAIDGFSIRNGTGTVYGSYRYGGGIYCSYSTLTITNNTITGSATTHGGGIYCNYAFPNIIHNTIIGNSATFGGGIYCNYASPSISNNMIRGNNGGGIYCYYSPFPAIMNNVIAGNSGSGICCLSSSPTITNNTITGNTSIFGGGIYCSSSASTPTIANNIVAFNSSGILNGGGNPTLQSNDVYANTDYNYSGLPAGTSDVSYDPQLIAAEYGQVHLQAYSPCIDAGNNDLIKAEWVDMDGQTRIQGTRVDIGADEYDGAFMPDFTPHIVRVSATGNDENDGSCWSLAKQTVQAGLDTASELGGEVWVTAGVYHERITLRPYAYLYGGFTGAEEIRGKRNWNQNTTVLDGDSNGCVVDASYCGYQGSTIDGFIIRNGTGYHATSGGAIYCYNASPAIRNNTIIGNTATGSSGRGGGIYCYASSSSISNNLIMDNTAPAGGGGIYCDQYSKPIISNNRIVGNRSPDCGGGIYTYASDPIIINNLFLGNNAQYGGGIYCSSYWPQILNNTITSNNASINGGGIGCSSSYLTIANNMIVSNSSGVYQTKSVGAPILRCNNIFSNTQYNYSGVTNPTGTNGNISVDPRFIRKASAGADGTWGTADDDYGDLRLMAVSSCIDAGSNADVPSGILTDLAGLSRFIDDPAMPDTGSGTAPIVDMGAYEMASATPGDGNRDDHVDSLDFDLFSDCYSGPIGTIAAGCSAFDFNGDQHVDATDFDTFSACYNGPVNPPGCR